MILVFFYILLEIYEVQWQSAPTLMDMLSRMYTYYNKSIFLFLIMHPTLYFAIWLMILSDYNIYALVLFLLKAADIFTKLYFIKQIFIDKKISDELKIALSTQLDKYMPYIGLLIYPPLVYMALN
ncbi:hypothetical protein [Sulfurimonas autotrophica]|uniref:Uncharacterized protein n=1 Tax=Sulfurimonas autotrophica (strain ATCC BAA-671 / DSM 16294 / JCM 11897 / OK10) TaxID=563040 RepID=E0UTS7_SULAO|nr:hypothetical protein [Sulfurimonas autotrophica]ADN09371.1 conserved hypothetical protein [Sulfurimonas autotrophica DSM 16294]